MIFDFESAVKVRKRDDGFYEKDTFDVSTAMPIPGPVGTVLEAMKKPPEQLEAEREKKTEEAVTDGVLTHEKELAVAKAGLMTAATGGAYPVIQGATGAITGDDDLMMDRVTRGILYPEKTKGLYTKLPGGENVTGGWAILAGVSEDIVKYGVAGIVQGGLKTKLLAKSLAKDVDRAATMQAEEMLGSMTKGEGVLAGDKAGFARKLEGLKEKFVNAYMEKLGAIDVDTRMTGWQQLAARKTITRMLLDEIDASGLSIGLSIKPVVGNTVTVMSKGKPILGKVTEILGNRVTVEAEGRQIIAMMSQFRLPPLAEKEDTLFPSGATEEVKLLEFKAAIQGEGFVGYSPKQSRELLKFVNSLPENVSKKEALKKFEETEKTLSQELPASKTKKIVREETGQIKDTGGVVSERVAFIQSLRDRVKAAKQAENFTKEEIFDTQKDLTELIDKSELEPADKAKFLKTIKNIQTPEDLQKALAPKINKKGEVVGVGLEEKINILLDKMERRNIASDINNVKTEGLAVEYKKAIENIQERFDLKNRSGKTLAKREQMRDFINRLKSEGKDIPIPEKTIAMLDRPSLQEIDIEELKKVRAEVEHLARLGKTKQRAREITYEAKKEKIKQKLIQDVHAINSVSKPNVPLGESTNKMVDRYINLRNYFTKTRVGLTPMEGLADVTGMQSMKKELDKNFGEYLSFNDDNFRKWYELTKDFDEGNFDRIGAYAISQQEGGIERLLNSGITDATKIELSAEEEKAYNFARETFDKYFDQVAQYSKEVYNESVGKVENYVSFMSDFENMNDLEMYDRFGQRPQEAINKRTKTVEQGFTKSRAATSNVQIETNIDKIFRRHLDDVAYLLTMGRDIKMYYEVVNSPEMRESLGDVGAMAWLQWLDLMARKGGVDSAKRIAALDILRRNVGAGVLAYRLSSALVQISSFGDTMATMGEKYATKGATNIATSQEWRNFIMDHFPEIKKAVGDDVAFREFGDSYFDKAVRLGMAPLQFMDGVMRSVAASGAYEKIAAERGVAVDLANPDKDIIQEATKLMRQSQGSSFFKDQPLAITTGYGLAENQSVNKTILQFQSFMLGRWDNINRQIYRLGIKDRNYKKAIMSLLWLVTFGLAGSIGTRKMSNAITGKPKRKDEPTFTEEMVKEAIGTVPLVGSLSSSIAYSSNPVPIIKTMNDVFDGASTVAKGEKSKTKLKGAVKVLGAGGALAGVPGSTTIAESVNNKLKDNKRRVRD